MGRVTEWRRCELGDALTLQRGFDLPYRLRREGNIPIVSSSGISAMHDSAQVCGPGVVTGRYGTIGEVFYIAENFWPLNTTLYVREFKGNDPLYLSYLLRTVDFASHSGKSGVPGINRNDIHKLPIVLPPLPEQRAIAEALSDMDKLLGSLEKLIAKKRAIKQAAMQELLTGKTRLPGFSGEWKTRRLGELTDLIPSGIYGAGSQTGLLIGMPVATTAHIDLNDTWNDKKMDIRYFTEDQVAYFHPLEGDLIVVKSSGSAASIQSGKIGYVSRDRVGSFIFSNFLMLLRPTGCNARFLFFQLVSRRVKRMLPYLVEASTYPNIRINDYLEIRIPLPPEEEQAAVATVLSDMDAEIITLEHRRDKTHAIKQGMMQQLLTGRVRLVSA